jgi:glycosyltransferase involved in cell wall biosynthesis
LAVSRFDELHTLVAEGVDCVLTPHVTLPDEYSDVTDRQYLVYGTYNLGFCALRATAEVERVVAWWSRRLEQDCIIDLPRGLFLDQKWADLLPSYIERTRVLRHPGYNVAYWNLGQRRVLLADGVWQVNGVALRFFHFSGIQIEYPLVFSRHNRNLTLENIGDLRWLLSHYRERVLQHGHDYYRGLPYAFQWNTGGRDNEHTSAEILTTRRDRADPTPHLPLVPAALEAACAARRETRARIYKARREVDAGALRADSESTMVRGYCFVCGQNSSFHTLASCTSDWSSRFNCVGCTLTSGERAALHILRQAIDPVEGDRIHIEGYRQVVAERLYARFPGTVSAAQDGADIIITAAPPTNAAIAEWRRRLRTCGSLLVTAPFGADIDATAAWTVAGTVLSAGFTNVTVLRYWSQQLCYFGDPQIVITAHRSANDSAPKPRVALIGHDAKPFGAQTLLLNVARTMVRNSKLEPLVVLGGTGALDPAYREIAPVVILRDTFADAERLYEVAQRLHGEGVTVALCNTLVSAKTIPALRAAGLRVVTLVHELPDLIRRYNLVDAAKIAAENSDVVVFASQVVHDAFIGLAGPVVNRRVIRPQGLYAAPPPETDLPALRAQGRARLQATEQNLVVLSAGYGDRRKGIDLWPDLVWRVCADCPEALFTWAGMIDPQEAAALARDLRATSCANHVRLLGQIADMPALYAAADVFLLPSREDPYPSVVLEAMAYGLPVIAFDGAGGLTELLLETGNTPVPYLDVARMAGRIVAMAHDLQQRRLQGAEGARRIARDYDFADYVADLSNLANDAPRSVSVIVPNYNYGDYLRERIATICAQTYPVHEIILLDDASTDGSTGVIAELERDIGNGQRLRVVRNAENSGSVVRQWVRGVELAEGELVWIAEADDLCDPGFLAATVRGFDDHRVVLSYSQSRQIDGAGSVMRENYSDYLADFPADRWRYDYIRSGLAEIADALCVKNTIPNVSAVVFRRTALQRVLHEHREEIVALRNAADWCCYLLLLRHGAIAFTAQSLNSHRRHERSVTLSTNDRRHLNEIKQMQRLAAELVTVPAGKELAARNWAAAVAKLFALDEHYAY